jgi:hypothetical protein
MFFQLQRNSKCKIERTRYQQSTSFSLQQQYEEKGEKCSHMKEKDLFGKEVVAQVLFEAAPMSV